MAAGVVGGGIRGKRGKKKPVLPAAIPTQLQFLLLLCCVVTVISALPALRGKGDIAPPAAKL